MTLSAYNQHVKRGDKVTLLRSEHDIWIKRTAEDIQTLHDRDIAAGRWHDDGGEPILYGPFKSWPEDTHQLTVVVSSCRGQWLGWHRKPKGLRTGWCESLQCDVLFRSV
jgi:hypothetical protein